MKHQSHFFDFSVFLRQQNNVTLEKKKPRCLGSEMCPLLRDFIYRNPAFHEAYSGSSLYTNTETHEHILQFKKAEIKSEIHSHTQFYELIASPTESKTEQMNQRK